MLRTARLLILVTLAYNVGEGAIAIWAGIHASSVALVAFGADSYLQVAAATVVLWRLGIADPELGERAELWAVRFIGWTFLALAAALLFQSAWALTTHDGAGESVIGIALAAASVTVMPAVALWKLRIAAHGSIFALAAEAKETLACSYLSVTVLIGLTSNALLGWWWLDAITALLLTPWLVREGLGNLRENEWAGIKRLCSCVGCLFGAKACKRPCYAIG